MTKTSVSAMAARISGTATDADIQAGEAVTAAALAAAKKKTAAQTTPPDDGVPACLRVKGNEDARKAARAEHDRATTSPHWHTGLTGSVIVPAGKKSKTPGTKTDKAPDQFVALASADQDFGIVDAASAEAEAQALANEEGTPVSIRNTTTDKRIATMKPTTKQTKTAPKSKSAPKAKPAAKPAKAKATAKTNSAKPAKEGPSGMVAKIIELALRAKGVSPAELNKLTTWKGAPWKWLFCNPKKTGYADRWGYKFSVEKTDEGTFYKLAKKAG